MIYSDTINTRGILLHQKYGLRRKVTLGPFGRGIFSTSSTHSCRDLDRLGKNGPTDHHHHHHHRPVHRTLRPQLDRTQLRQQPLLTTVLGPGGSGGWGSGGSVYTVSVVFSSLGRRSPVTGRWECPEGHHPSKHRWNASVKNTRAKKTLFFFFFHKPQLFVDT